MVRRTLLSIALLLTSLTLLACGGGDGIHPEVGAIEGTIALEGRDATSGVTVAIKDTEVSRQTRSDGTFTFDPINAGTYTLQISYPDFFPKEVDVEVVHGETSTVEVELEQVNDAPSIREVSLDPGAMTAGGTITVTVTATDPNSDELTYEYSATNGFEVTETDGATATITAPNAFEVEGELTVVVSDPDGRSDSAKADLVTLDNTAPVIGGIVALPSTLAPGGTSNVSVNATDADGDELTYQWTAPSGWTIDNPTAAAIELTAPDAHGEIAVIEVEVTDAHGVSATSQTTVETAANTAPVISSLTATPPQTTPGGEIQLEASATDPDSSDLTYAWTSPSEWTIADASTETPTVTAPSSYAASGRITLVVTDAGGATATSSIVLSTNQNDGPLISSVTATPPTVARGGDVALSVTAADPNGDALSYSWSAPSGWSFDDATAKAPILTAPAQNSAVASISVTVTDSEGLSSTGSTVVSTEANQAPVISSLDAQPSQTKPGGTIAVSAAASDANGDALSYNWTPPAGWSMNGSGANITLTAPAQYGVSGPVKLEVADGFGGVATAQLSVSVEPNIAPTISGLSSDQNPVVRGASLTFRVDASDTNNPGALTYKWSLNNSAWAISAGDTTEQLTVTAPDTPDSTVTATVTVSDDAGATARATTTVSTRANREPIITSTPPSNTVHASGRVTWSYRVIAQDADDAELTYSLDADGTTATIDPTTGLLTWEPLRGDDGNYQFVVEVTDGYDTGSQQIAMTASGFDFEHYESYATNAIQWAEYSDLDGDGSDDIVGTNWGGSNSFLVGYWPSSEGHNQKYEVSNVFADYPTAGTESEFYACQHSSFLDLDADGHTDMVVSCRYRRDTSSGSSEYGPYIIPVFKNPSATSNADLLSLVSATGQASVPVKSGVPNNNDVRGMDIGDVDGDGDQDVVTSIYYHDGSTWHGRLDVFTNNGDGTLTSSDSADFSNRYFYGLTMLDWDADGTSEVMVSGYPQGDNDSGGVYAFDFNADGTVNTTQVEFMPTGREATGIAAADFNADGHLDVVLASRFDGGTAQDTVQIYTGDGAGDFALSEKRDLGTQYCMGYRTQDTVAVGDFDADGQVDVALPAYDWYRCPFIATVLFGDGAGGTGERKDLSGANGFQRSDLVHTADLNGDGLDDVATSYGGMIRAGY